MAHRTDASGQQMCFELQSLEKRLFLSGATPSAVIPATVEPSDLLSQSVRTSIVGKLPSGGLKNTLSPLVSDAAGFDAALLDHMQRKVTSRFYFGPDSIDDYKNYILANNLEGTAEGLADELLLHEFPLQGDGSSYDVQLPNNIDWDNTGYSSHSEFLPGLNRFAYWHNLAEAHLYTADSEYVQELINQLASWSEQNPVPSDPNDWQTTGGVGWDLLTASMRAESWTWAYAMVLDSSAWTKEANTLFVSRIYDLGDFLYRNRTVSGHGYELTSNRSIFHGKGLLLTAQMFSDFALAETWETAAREQLVDALEEQIYADGSHFEQSPGYASNVLSDLLEAKWLDELNNDAAQWPASAETRIDNALEAYRQMLMPDGTRPAVGDTYRDGSATLFFRAAMVEDGTTPASTTVNDPAAAGKGAGETQLLVTDASSFEAGDQIQLAGTSELLRVSGADTNSNTLTVERGYGGTSTSAWSDGATVFNFGSRPVARPRPRDAWLFGGDIVDPYMDLPADPVLGARGNTYALTNSGNYLFRSDETGDQARQLIFDAGPTGGGSHGHLDLFNFELYGYGRPLISDPGPYLYGQSSARNYVVSTAAHNTLSVGGHSHAYLENAGNPSIVIDDYVDSASSAQITAHHFGYQSLAGAPVVGRSLWYDLDGTMLIVDWGEANTSHTFTQAFNLQTEGDTTNVSAVQGDQSIKTRYDTGGNVRIAPVYVPGGQTASRSLKFVTNDESDGDYMDDAYRFTVSQTGTFAAFVTLITAYDGLTVPDTTATLVSGTPAAGQPIQVEVTIGGTPQTITFNPPDLVRPTTNSAEIDLGGANHIAWDSAGRLHMVFHDRLEKTLKYSVRETDGKWSIVQTIDNAENSGGGHISLALDSDDQPGVAYFDGTSGDLKYSKFRDGAWVVEKVDTSGSVGLNPSLVFSRNDGPMISYYHKTKGDLRLAVSGGGGWIISTIDHVGNVGRWTKLLLDPNRPTSSKAVILYEDSSNGDYKLAVQGTFGDAESFSTAGYSLYRIDNLTRAGGYTSLAFRDTGIAGSQRYQPAAAYYEGTTLSLRYAWKDASGWHASNVVTGQRRGQYNTLFFDDSGEANIFFWNRNQDTGWRASGGPGSWSFSALNENSRSMTLARKDDGTIAFTSQDDEEGHLKVTDLGS